MDPFTPKAWATLEALMGFPEGHWTVAYSGGKDSTTLAILALEAARMRGVESLTVLYADTGVEIPPLREWALGFLEALKAHPHAQGVPLRVEVVRPAPEEGFFYHLLGKGYPPPHRLFRWCTRRLKVTPMGRALGKEALVLTGVRLGESRDRDSRLCRRGGECGSGHWLGYPRGVAPLLHWRDCDVWDFLEITAPALGYPTEGLKRLYFPDGKEERPLRFGCWTCTVVRQDRTMGKLVEGEWEGLRALLEFRNRLVLLQRDPSLREERDGRLGPLTLEVRRRLLQELLEMEEKVGFPLLSPEEKEAIGRAWEGVKARDEG